MHNAKKNRTLRLIFFGSMQKFVTGTAFWMPKSGSPHTPLRESNKGIDRYRSSFSNALWRKEKRIGNCSVARECKALHQSKSRNETPQSAAPTAPLIGEPTLPPLLGEVPPQGAEGFFIFLRFHGRLNSYSFTSK